MITESFIPHLNKSEVMESIVAVPNKTEQELLVHTNYKLNELQSTIEDLKSELKKIRKKQKKENEINLEAQLQIFGEETATSLFNDLFQK